TPFLPCCRSPPLFSLSLARRRRLLPSLSPHPIEARVLTTAAVATHLSFLFSSSISATTSLFVGDDQDSTARGRHSGLAEVRGAGEGVRRPSRRPRPGGARRSGAMRRRFPAMVESTTVARRRAAKRGDAAASVRPALVDGRPRRCPEPLRYSAPRSIHVIRFWGGGERMCCHRRHGGTRAHPGRHGAG
ncbi:unnamed protein product, partial [Urochloa humidicola]